MGRRERELDPENIPLHRFALELRNLRIDAGKPSYRELARRTHFSVTALSEAAGGAVMPSLPVTLAYVEACGGNPEEWRKRWHSLSEETTTAEPARDQEKTSPYLGLMTFGPQDASLFFGRERLLRQVCERMLHTPFLALFGPSGTGKSSLLQAGVLPAVERGDVGGGQGWRVVCLTPGERPVQELAITLANAQGVAACSVQTALADDPQAVQSMCAQLLAGGAATAHLVIVVDQFEEIFTLCGDRGERDRFVAALLAASAEPRVRLVLSVRADFYAHCAFYPALVAALQDNQILVGPMEEDDLRCAVTRPAQQMGLKVQPELVELVVDEARQEPGALSLVSHALLETWRSQRGASLTVAAYRAAGGVRGAVAQTAERVYGGLGEAEREVARRLFLRLTVPGDGTEDSRRRASRAEMTGGPDSDRAAHVLDTLIAARLITAEEDSVTIAHEALIRGWPRLRSWLEEDRELLWAHLRLTGAAAEWDEHDRDEAFLYRGARLRRWDGQRRDGLNDLEHTFLQASRHREVAEREGRRRRVRTVLAALVSVTVVVSVLAGVAVKQAREAQDQRDVALSRQLAAEARAELQLSPERGLRLARRAYALWPTAEAVAVLRQGVADDHLVATIPGLGRALGVAFSPDGRRLAASSADGLVRVWSWSGEGVTADAPLVLRGHRGEVWSPQFSPDGRRLAAAGLDGTIRVWELSGRVEPVVLTGHDGPVWAVAFSPDGRRLASAGDDGTTGLWDVGGGEATFLRGHGGAVKGVAFSPDGRFVASGADDGSIRMWSASGGGRPRVLRGHEDAVKTVAFSPDGKILASVSVDGTARLWRTGGKGQPRVLHGHEGTAEGLAFSRDGHRLATTSDDSTVRVWSSTQTGDPLVLRGHQRVVWSASFSADGRRLATAGDDGTVRIWDPRGMGDPSVLRGHEGAAWSAAFTPDGRRVVSGGVDGVVRVWDPAREASRVLRGHKDEVVDVATGPDGRVASASTDGTLRIWNLTDGSKPVTLRGHKGIVWSVSFSPDGRRVASAGLDGTLRIWDLTGAAPPVVRRADTEQIRYAAFSPDGRQVATGGKDGTVRIWESGGAAEPLVLRGHQGLVWGVAFSPDGRRLASAGTDGTVRIWPTSGGGGALVLRGHQNVVWWVAFSPDGRWVAGTGHDGTVRIWRTDMVAPPVTVGGFATSVESVEFSPDDGRIATTHGDGTVRLWRCTACEPIERLLARVDRLLVDR
ncbi:hypothetical protein AB0G15_33825 [Streptosporangium sp. NPDC023825]|uniref:nSTAND1 domain-containing NTPase n=1 Tax=Streptosporangium sp. NPDC023825 TaxID=3154909 RepID=UPI0034349887